MNDFVRENAQLSPLKVCVAVLLRTRFLAAAAAQLPQDDLTALDTVLVDLLSESGAHTTRFRDLLARLHAHPFQVPDQVIAVYTSAVCALFPSLYFSPVHTSVPKQIREVLTLSGLEAFIVSLQALVLPSPDVPVPPVEAERRAERRNVYTQPLVCVRFLFSPLSVLFTTLSSPQRSSRSACLGCLCDTCAWRTRC